MSLDLTARPAFPWGLAALIAAQTVCALFFAGDVVADLRDAGTGHWHLSIESVATVLIVITVIVEARILARMLRQQARLRRAASVAQAAIAEVIEAHIASWGLTPAEEDVANLLIKGFPNAEIARLRGSAEGTVKAQLNAIYRKSGASNRAELLSRILDSLMEEKSEAEAG